MPDRRAPLVTLPMRVWRGPAVLRACGSTRHFLPGQREAAMRWSELPCDVGSARPGHDIRQSPAAARITIVLHDFSAGGTEHVALRLADAWSASGRDVTLFCGTEGGQLRDLVAPGVAVVRASRECVRGPRSRARLGAALADFLKLSPQDVVFAPGNFHLPVLARCAQLGTSGATTICKLSNPVTSRSSNPAITTAHNFILRQMAAWIDAFVAMSPALRDAARDALGRPDTAMAWEPILADALPIRRPAPSGRPLVLVIGRLERQKNIELALDAFACSRAANDADLLLLGEGRLRARLARRAKKLGIADRVIMPGYRNAVQADLARASALLLTSHFEGYPAVLVEAIAAGVPVITTPCSPAISEIVGDYPSSIIVPPDVGLVAAAIDATLAGGRSASDAAPGRLHARHRIGAAAAGYLMVFDAVRRRSQRSIGVEGPSWTPRSFAVPDLSSASIGG
ncbi:glycosyltransferase [Sphingomonas nostoxanthinifaciens]|uniref:glycosyltransferase n=1 Tax=Sphingomonas nostoxanthinifaciens TaxID=2872652 RepID=UPI002953E8B6|nr:glycosyltransferase [Sphingomonas nostoxanthinifaciens]